MRTMQAVAFSPGVYWGGPRGLYREVTVKAKGTPGTGSAEPSISRDQWGSQSLLWTLPFDKQLTVAWKLWSWKHRWRRLPYSTEKKWQKSLISLSIYMWYCDMCRKGLSDPSHSKKEAHAAVIFLRITYWWLNLVANSAFTFIFFWNLAFLILRNFWWINKLNEKFCHNFWDFRGHLAISLTVEVGQCHPEWKGFLLHTLDWAFPAFLAHIYRARRCDPGGEK